jgi:hypothetical protein
MRRSWLLLFLIALAAPTPSAHASATQAPPLAATLESCLTSSLPIQRVGTFVGSMPAAGANRMRIRFDLERRRPAERRWRHIQAPGFGAWEDSDPGVAGLVFRKRVNGLPVPASYRALVRFRWIAADGSVMRRAEAHTPACVQPDLRPNLVPGALTAILDAQPGLGIYTLIVRNIGRSAASASSVQVGAGSAEVAPLAAGEQRAVTVIALACRPGEAIVARVDADRRVDEASERANSVRRPCPLRLG